MNVPSFMTVTGNSKQSLTQDILLWQPAPQAHVSWKISNAVFISFPFPQHTVWQLGKRPDENEAEHLGHLGSQYRRTHAYIDETSF